MRPHFLITKLLLSILAQQWITISQKYWCCWGCQVDNIKVHRVPLRQKDKLSPFCLAASSAMDVMNTDTSTSINFLATQVWPSARVAAMACERHLDQRWTVCEFGCGPGLPSLTAANMRAKKVYATDLDSFALKLVQEAGRLQALTNLETRQVDLCAEHVVVEQEIAEKPTVSNNIIPRADLYIFSDVFESPAVAIGAARVTQAILSSSDNHQPRVWVFAQTDRACREIYLQEMRNHLTVGDLSWQPLEEYDPNSLSQKLFLFDLDETMVAYG